LPNIFTQDIQVHKADFTATSASQSNDINLSISFEYQWIYDSDQLKLKSLIEKQSKMEKVVYDYKEALKKVEIKFK
jgi:hypothetical protein